MRAGLFLDFSASTAAVDLQTLQGATFRPTGWAAGAFRPDETRDYFINTASANVEAPPAGLDLTGVIAVDVGRQGGGGADFSATTPDGTFAHNVDARASSVIAFTYHADALTCVGTPTRPMPLSDVLGGSFATFLRQANRVTGTSLDDRLLGGDGNDTLLGLAGNDTLSGDAGRDEMAGGSGDDQYLIDSRQDRVVEGVNEGFDRVIGAVAYRLPANVEALTLTGTARLRGDGNGLDNALLGNDGANTLNGLDGADTLTGSLGGDRLNGGAGADHFLYLGRGDSPAGRGLRDTIQGFQSGVDEIDLRAIDADGNPLNGDTPFTFIGDRPFGAVAGQLRFERGVLVGDTTGDGLADFEIQIQGRLDPGQDLLL